MSTYFVENVIDQIYTILYASIAAKLDTIDTEKDDGIVLDDIVKWYKCQKIKIGRYPSIEIFPTSSPGENHTAYGVRSEHEISIRISEVGSDEEELFKRIWRYLRAITEILMDSDTLRSADYGLCNFRGHEYDEVTEGNAGLLYRGTVNIMVDQHEHTNH